MYCQLQSVTQNVNFVIFKSKNLAKNVNWRDTIVFSEFFEIVFQRTIQFDYAISVSYCKFLD